MSPLQLSSIFFLTISIHSYNKYILYYYLYICLTCSSILFYTVKKHNYFYDKIKLIDMALAHFAFIVSFYDVYIGLLKKYNYLILFQICLALNWVIQNTLFHYSLDIRNKLHFYLHLTTIIGMHTTLYLLY
jgi:hypothetical protein